MHQPGAQQAGLWPDLVLSGHAHLYQGFTRTTPRGKETPYIVCGAGGFAVTALMATLPPAPITIGDHRLEINPILDFGYLTVETDARTLSVTFTVSDAQGRHDADSVTVDLATGKLKSGDVAKPVKPAQGAAVTPAGKPTVRAAPPARQIKKDSCHV